MNKPHKHAELIKAWADGAEIEFFSKMHNEWQQISVSSPSWFIDIEYRIKPEPKPDVVAFMGIESQVSVDAIVKDSLQSGKWSVDADHYMINHCPHQLKLTFDGETGKLKSAEVINND